MISLQAVELLDPQGDLALPNQGPVPQRLLGQKLAAAGLHLILSVALVGLVGLLMMLLWYPWPIFLAAGATGLLMLVSLCDVVLGPALTFVVYRPRKRSLRTDLAVIAMLQIAALGYGMYSVYLARPVFNVFAVDRFELVSAAEMEPAQLALARPEYQELSLTGPRLVAAQLPDDLQERQKLMFSALNSGIDLRLLPRYYVEYHAFRKSTLARAKPIATLREYNRAGAVDAVLENLGMSEASVVFVPLVGKRGDLTVLLDARTGAIARIVNLRPWP